MKTQPGEMEPPLPVGRGAAKAGFALKPGPIFYNMLSLAAGLLVWQFASLWVASPFFPGPAKILEAFQRLAISGDTMGNSLWAHSWGSLHRVLVGFGFAVLLGVPLGLLMGLKKGIYTSTRAIIEPFRFIPPIAWIPLASSSSRGSRGSRS